MIAPADSQALVPVLKLAQDTGIAILEHFQSSFNGQQRKLGFEDAMQAAGMKLVDSQSAQWEMSVASQTTAGMLTSHPEIKAILSGNDSMTPGAMPRQRRQTEKMCWSWGLTISQSCSRPFAMVRFLRRQINAGINLLSLESSLLCSYCRIRTPHRRGKNPVDLVTAETL